MVRLVILGTRVFAEEVADLVEQAGEHELAAFAENWERERCDRQLLGRPVVWVDDLPELAATHQAVCAIGTTRRRVFVEQAAGHGIGFTTVRHPSAIVSPSAAIGEGAIVGARVVVGAHTRIGSHAILNRGVLVGHHTEIGDYVTASPGANIAGLVTIGDGAYIGMGATVIDRITIGANSLVGAGAVVTKDVPEGVQVQGVPARIVRRGIEGH
jgi:acetyltransferase EpsM